MEKEKIMKHLLTILFVFVGLGASAQFKNNNEPIFNANNYGAQGDAIRKVTGSSNSNTTFTCLDCVFTQSDIGKIIQIDSVGASHAALNTTISAVGSSTSITLGAATSFTRTGTVHFVYGTESGPGIQKAINAWDAAGRGKVVLPDGFYVTNQALVTSDNKGNNPNSVFFIPGHNYPDSTRGHLIIEGGSNIIYPSDYAFAGPNYNSVQVTGTIIKSFLTSGSGSQPAIVGSIGNGTTYNFVDVEMKNLTFEVSTNSGSIPPQISGINFKNIDHVTLKRVVTCLDVSNLVSSNPNGVESAGMMVSNLSNLGENIIEDCWSSGFKYAFIYSEHTTVISAYSFCSTYAHVIPICNYTVTGTMLFHACVHGIYFPTATTMGYNAGTAYVDIKAESEIDAAAQIGTFWYNTVDQVTDVNGLGVGIIKMVNQNPLSAGPLAPIVSTSGINLIITPWLVLPLGQNITGVSETDIQQNATYNTVVPQYQYRAFGRAMQIQLFDGSMSVNTFPGVGSAIGGVLPLGIRGIIYTDSTGTLNTGTQTPVPSAQFQVFSTTKGMLPPKVTTTQMNAISSPVDGLHIYNTTTHAPYWYENGAWQGIGQGPFSVTAGTIASGASGFSTTATMPTTLSGFTAANKFTVTGAGSSSQLNEAMYVSYAAGYTGASSSIGLEVDQANASTGNNLQWNTSITNPLANLGANYFAFGTTAGANIGSWMESLNGILNVGGFGKAAAAINSGTNIGLIGQGRNTGTTPIEIGGYFTLGNAAPTYASAAVVADNADQSVPVALFRVNGVTKAQIDATGNYVSSTAQSHGLVDVSGTGTYSALGTDYTIQFTGTTATLAYPTLNLVNGRHLNIVNNASGSVTIPSTKSGNASTITTLTTGQRAQVEYDLTNTTWIIVSLN